MWEWHLIINSLYYYARDDNDICCGVHIKILLLCFRCPRTVQITMNLILSFWATLLVNLTLFKPIFMWTVSVTESKDWTFGLTQPRNSTPTRFSGTSATYCKDHTPLFSHHICDYKLRVWCALFILLIIVWCMSLICFSCGDYSIVKVDFCYFNFKWVLEALHKAKNCCALLISAVWETVKAGGQCHYPDLVTGLIIESCKRKKHN